jgi:hypothetical protein
LAARDRFGEGEISPLGLLVIAGRLTARLERVVKGHFTHHGHRRLANFLKNHGGEVFAYLRHPGMAARNYRGEQSIRPAVVKRKVWGGNRTWRGTWAQAVIMSVIGTCILRDIEPLAFLVEALTSSTPAPSLNLRHETVNDYLNNFPISARCTHHAPGDGPRNAGETSVLGLITRSVMSTLRRDDYSLVLVTRWRSFSSPMWMRAWRCGGSNTSSM